MPTSEPMRLNIKDLLHTPLDDTVWLNVLEGATDEEKPEVARYWMLLVNQQMPRLSPEAQLEWLIDQRHIASAMVQWFDQASVNKQSYNGSIETLLARSIAGNDTFEIDAPFLSIVNKLFHAQDEDFVPLFMDIAAQIKQRIATGQFRNRGDYRVLHTLAWHPWRYVEENIPFDVLDSLLMLSVACGHDNIPVSQSKLNPVARLWYKLGMNSRGVVSLVDNPTVKYFGLLDGASKIPTPLAIKYLREVFHAATAVDWSMAMANGSIDVEEMIQTDNDALYDFLNILLPGHAKHWTTAKALNLGCEDALCYTLDIQESISPVSSEETLRTIDMNTP